MPGFALRQRHVSTESPNEEKSQTPFGIPIYQYLKDLRDEESKSAEQEKANAAAPPPTKKRKKRKHEAQILLCEKYRPKEFFDLCGNADAHRRALRWMSYWKSIVFGTEPTFNDYTDRLGRPLKKILLLNGPPGTGKTTAAHVIANQAGFDVLEINASDERGAAVVQERIVSAIQSHQVHRKRPICIVADEVEGASEHGFVRALVNIIKSDAAALAKTDAISGKSSKNRKKNKNTLLLRPIIAVCNNAWASSLHNLRPLAEIVTFTRQPASLLVKQLEYICEQEKIKMSYRELVSLVEQNNHDLRSCLIALQYRCNMDGAESSDNVEDTNWDSMLREQFGSKKPLSFKQIECCSDIDRLVMGCFTAYPELGFNDDLVKKPADLGDYLALCDSRHANAEIKSLAIHACGQLFRTPDVAAGASTPGVGAKYNWYFGRPVNTYEVVKQTKGIVQSVLKRASNSVRTGVSESTALMDLLPFLTTISSAPKLSTVTSLEDKSRLYLIADLLIENGITFKSEKLENGSFGHILDPPIHQACIIDENERSEAKFGSYISRGKIKNILQEIKSRETRLLAQSQFESRAKHNKVEEETKKPAKPIVDFSNFFLSKPNVTATQVERNAQAKATRVWIQYSEGFSNAVRKNISWNDLFNH